ncbi:translation initiation factor IF-5A [Sulfolobus acidocaldarius]|uniref:Translation initiation factor 5A n=4 Tax=Sulfolobus acidocaldarius TaxID=2285 RepID=IF5A_SULAC|nr:translation initiation factor IF-5A [Sulfolobus acidocaldarius]P28461.2 RecName: Full=Translation initiation factor 5A; AltName: Full=Hypusine-containing protein; AltName: Full=SHP; AltName: Full=eIF-5A [Sulfolobus acidocaldarius DSM 639]AHC51581.1 translation initiation factor IF-5A [Sulfolobus acidocaldarius SUSAZ]AAY80649.1 translation initiation factor 5A [Sulfolobus acidocaldarius DSM 639]AGE71245.1 translation initiation factor IF-5A [Sulfolobus acidocaldarius N8]AGE73514.1 translatio
MSIQYTTVGDLKVGSYVMIDGEPCRVVEITKAKTGKHGSAKANVVAIGLFTGQKRSLMAPVDQQVEVPIIEKHVGQILADKGDNLTIMDLESYETFDLEKPTENEIVSKIRPGAEIEYWSVMGRRKIVRVK